MPTPFAEVAHIDMLHPARRMWRQEEVECRLTYLEGALCGHERDGDVPGFEIPSRYFQYVRSLDARPLEAVFEHNRLDIVSLAMLTARAAQLLEEGPSMAMTAREALGMGRLYERAGLLDDAIASYDRAAEVSHSQTSSRALVAQTFKVCATRDTVSVRVEALRASAILLRRLRRYEDAAVKWRALLTTPLCPASYAREANEALAVHHEHRARDLETARLFALQSLKLHATAARQQAIRYRLARLDRKLGFTSRLQRPSAALF
jgi:tetratricopeptide (TPR) repeat protein